MEKINIRTSHRSEIVDITAEVEKSVAKSGVESGLVVVYSPHTTAGISVNENADPDVKRDMISYLNKTVPQDSGFAHMEGNSDSHIKGSMMNFSQTFIIEDGRVQLGTWQGIFFMEFDGPRNRNVWVKVV